MFMCLFKTAFWRPDSPELILWSSWPTGLHRHNGHNTLLNQIYRYMCLMHYMVKMSRKQHYIHMWFKVFTLYVYVTFLDDGVLLHNSIHNNTQFNKTRTCAVMVLYWRADVIAYKQRQFCSWINVARPVVSSTSIRAAQRDKGELLSFLLNSGVEFMQTCPNHALCLYAGYLWWRSMDCKQVLQP